MKTNPVVVVSSTAQDLAKYRALVTDACLRADMFPKMMEQLPALSEDAIRASLDMVDQADLYVGIFAHRYGYVPAGHDISITEMEYERAVQREIPVLIFMMDDDVPVLPKDFDTENAEKLKALKQRLRKKHVVASFTSPEDLRGLVVDSLARARATIDTAQTDAAGQPTPAALAKSIHYVSDIPQPPEPYIAHPYTLLQVRGLVGRKEELEMLTDWATGDPRYAEVRIFNVVAMGGMGKSALTWTWFNEVAPQEMTPLAGRMWWSFYESDATFENFVTRALAYVSGQTLDEVRKLTIPEQEDLLLRTLDREPFLIVLDGLERVLVAYARQDAAYLRDDSVSPGGRDTSEGDQPQGGFPALSAGKHRLRKTADLRAGRFLRALAAVRASRIIINTRLYPADLEAPGGNPSPGSYELSLSGLTDHDALDLWRAFGAGGSLEVMLPVFQAFDKHPLLLQLLAAEVAEFRDAPGDFDRWRTANADFDPFGIPLIQVQSHVLTHAIRGLSPAEIRTLRVIAAFRMPAGIDTLKALLIGGDEPDDPVRRPFRNVGELDAALTALEDRGLLGWERHSNRYDLHPLVRGVVWSGLDTMTRADLLETLRTHFAAMPCVEDLQVESLDQLTPAVEHYNTLIGLQLYDEALKVFYERLQSPTLYRLSASHLRVELVTALFPDGVDSLPRINGTSEQSFALDALAAGYHQSGRPSAAVPLLRLADEIDQKENFRRGRMVGLGNLADVLRVIGRLRDAESAACQALAIVREDGAREREGAACHRVGLVQGTRGASAEAAAALRRSLRTWLRQKDRQGEGMVSSSLAELALWRSDAAVARVMADRAWELAGIRRLVRDVIRAARAQGTSALHAEDWPTASARLQYALLRARTVSLVEEELPTLVALAEFHWRQGDAGQARAMLNDVWEAAERGPYPLFQADALNVLAQIERDEGDRDKAVEAATKAYQLAWCDGPPFAYHWGLQKAKAHLAALGAPEPEMSPFDESKYEPMPEVEINPPDEFGGDDSGDEA